MFFKLLFSLFAVGLGVFSSPSVFITSQPGPSEDALWLSPITYSHHLDGPILAPASSFWYLTQWSGTSQMNATSAVLGSGPCAPFESNGWETLWHVSTETIGAVACMQVKNSQHALLTLQNGVLLPCGAEYDLFLAPTDKAYDNAPQNVIPLSLGSISFFNVSFDAELLTFSTAARCGPVNSCGPSGHLDYGYIVLGIVLSSGDQTIFYQTILADTRTAPSCPREDPCSPFAFWYGTNFTVGFSESITNLKIPGATCLNTNLTASTHYALPLYNRLVQSVIDATTLYPGMNSNISEWFATGIYVGTGMEGSTTAAFRIGGVNVVTS